MKPACNRFQINVKVTNLGHSVRLFLPLIYACVTIASSATEPVPLPDLLEGEKAFEVSARLTDNKTLEVKYVIADGYYLYRDRFRFLANGQPIVINRKSWPAGKWKQDVTFGRVVTFRKSVRLLIPLPSMADEVINADGNKLILIAHSQGCADVGVCYPPLRQTIALTPSSSHWVVPESNESSGISYGFAGGKLIDHLKNSK